MNFANVNGIMIPVNGVQKEVASITDSMNRVIWQKNTIDYSIPFYFKNKGARGTIGVRINKTNIITQTINLQYSYDLQTWTNCSISNYTKSRSFDLGLGETIYFRGTNDGWSISSSGSAGGTYQNGGFYLASNLTNLEVGGNIMSLLFGSDFTTQRSLDSKYTYTFNGLMESNLNAIITNADNLLLPATTLKDNCYRRLLSGSAITSAPALPATSITYDCYYGMFYGCTALTTAPELPATTLFARCYYEMFRGCTSLTKAPDLPAPTLANNCYYYMFYGCSSLNEVKCLATDISAANCVGYWMSNVAASGTFYKASSMTSWPRTPSGIPSGWTVVDVP